MATTQNNFDLLRLLAALQVAVHHSLAHLAVPHDWPVLRLTEWLPGVPIFFFLSGFLISASYERNSSLPEYASNRVLRIYPALIACLVVSVALTWSTGYFGTIDLRWSQVALWLLAQLSFLQFHNPEFLRDYGVGALNGSLWTIVVELQFYVLVPIIYGMLRLRASSARTANALLSVVILMFLAISQGYFASAARYADETWFKLLGVSFVPWFYMFLVGVLAQRNFALLQRWLAGRWSLVALGYIGLALLADTVLGWSFGNALHPLLFLALAGLIVASAITRPWLSDRLLGRNDFSYGIYIYHMPVVNFWLAEGWGGTTGSFATVLAATVLLAVLSWLLVERPALRLKRHPLYQHAVSPQVGS